MGREAEAPRRDDAMEPATPAGELEVLAAECLLPWGEAAEGLPGAAERALPPVPGFAMSRFTPLVVAAARAAWKQGARHRYGGHRTAIVLATMFGDAMTADQHTRRQFDGLPHNPLFFYESVLSSCVGMIGIEHGIGGPISCLSLRRDFTVEALTAVDVLLDEESIDQVLLIGAELAPTPRTSAIHRGWAEENPTEPLPQDDLAAALLLRRPTGDPGRPESLSTSQAAAHVDSVAATGADDPLGHLRGLVGLCAALAQLRTTDPARALLVRSNGEDLVSIRDQ
ncbi:beta-ketoacyl-[acyl-carrier-protein] synthase family protein [Actinoalloteichus hymeniacidonis]|uniref:Beta-ketoacyl synthase N-terminal domain-containing protein n=1 Tax=Actinoalloteichus hymeniacidonis TaxID=340345 RepID=A0AAC9HMU2_9PSEU|nr:hypothetical protein [Actinoalloteichus hymeniacidonis]AOS62168.1 hypothetical protein TL08_06720 [Actinoalloteichus hymeniacidonis]MBB5909809.1 hypothetical protein [Actinoalloteichus hymeniacidonis]